MCVLLPIVVGAWSTVNISMEIFHSIKCSLLSINMESEEADDLLAFGKEIGGATKIWPVSMHILILIH